VFKLKAFLLILAGQVVSILGSTLSGFALGIWLYQTTGSASNFALTALCSVLPRLLVSPLAGGLVDRYSRKWMMALGDSGAAVCTLGLAALFFGGRMHPWQVFLGTALSSACSALQEPAYDALVASAVQKAQLGRANGLIQFGQGLAEVLAPALAGVLVALIGVPGVLFVDLATFVIAVTTLLLVSVPEQGVRAGIGQVQDSPSGRVSLWAGLNEGWKVVRVEAGLSALLRFQMLFSFLWSLFAVLVSPMILGFTGAPGLGLALSVAGGGKLVGSLALVAGAAFLAHFTLAFVAGLNQSIWQSQVGGAVMGRVLGLRQAAVQGATLVAYLLAGGMADRLLNPLLLPGGALVSGLGAWIGVGPGRGIAALCILIGLVKAAAAVGVAFSPAGRGLDRVM